jgi:hypothetical protein
MAYNPAEALRAAGILDGPMAPELEEFYASLTQQETETLISLKSRLEDILPEVVAHSQDWATPEAAQQGFDAAMLCACSIWSGAGSKAA